MLQMPFDGLAYAFRGIAVYPAEDVVRLRWAHKPVLSDVPGDLEIVREGFVRYSNEIQFGIRGSDDVVNPKPQWHALCLAEVEDLSRRCGMLDGGANSTGQLWCVSARPQEPAGADRQLATLRAHAAQNEVLTALEVVRPVHHRQPAHARALSQIARTSSLSYCEAS